MMPDKEGKPESLPAKRRSGKLQRCLRALEEQLSDLESYYESYVRLHRVVYDCDPDTTEVGDGGGGGDDVA